MFFFYIYQKHIFGVDVRYLGVLHDIHFAAGLQALPKALLAIIGGLGGSAVGNQTSVSDLLGQCVNHFTTAPWSEAY